ncbi:6677_t:CDS:1, partial [Dentiscutata erythropus]
KEATKARLDKIEKRAKEQADKYQAVQDDIKKILDKDIETNYILTAYRLDKSKTTPNFFDSDTLKKDIDKLKNISSM